MLTYLILTNGFANADEVYETFDLDENASARETNQKLVELAGGKLIDMYYTGGAYDAALVAEFPDQETALRARYQAREFGVDDVTVLDAVHYEEMDGTMAT